MHELHQHLSYRKALCVLVFFISNIHGDKSKMNFLIHCEQLIYCFHLSYQTIYQIEIMTSVIMHFDLIKRRQIVKYSCILDKAHKREVATISHL